MLYTMFSRTSWWCYSQHYHTYRGVTLNIHTLLSLSYTAFKHITWCNAQHSHMFLPVIYNTQTYISWCHARYSHALRDVIHSIIRPIVVLYPTFLVVIYNIQTHTVVSYTTLSHLSWCFTEHSLLSYTTLSHLSWCYTQHSVLAYTTFKHIPWCHLQHSHIYRGIILNILTLSSLSYTTFKHISWCHAQYYHALRGFIYTQIRCRSTLLSRTCMSSASIIITFYGFTNIFVLSICIFCKFKIYRNQIDYLFLNSLVLFYIAFSKIDFTSKTHC